ncbi:MAG: hypothetical protein KDA57_12505 [Planctomycetales bacterium]|nr:hypothetical protein [Planctomycetales bacterium]
MKPLVCCLPLCLFLDLLSSAQAEPPLVVAFDAVISEIEGDPLPLDLPFTLNIGDQIEGELAFDSRHEALLQLQGNTTIFSNLTLSLGGDLIDNFFNVALVNSFFFLNDERFPGPIDPDNPPSSIYFSYFPVSTGNPGWVGSGLQLPWTAEILMYGEPGTIDSPHNLLNFDDWNRLEQIRNLTILIGFPETVTVTARLGNLSEVPEPSTLAIAIFAIIVLVRRRITNQCYPRP